jgi:phosphopantothenoylcysteine decarboxylase/phosphopantothenate--cysteine ligase
MDQPSSILLIISGSVSAYKALELIRLLQKQHITVQAVLTKGGQEFITPLAVSSLTGTKSYTDLFSLTDEVEMGHIELSRKHDLLVVAPASADILAKMAHGMADDLASTLLLATDKPVMVAPAMNHKMWEHPATQRNIKQLQEDGVSVIPPEEGAMACGEYGVGRLAEVEHLAAAIVTRLTSASGPLPLSGKQALITAGPTYEPLDAVRFLGNYSSGKQGIAIARVLQQQGAQVTLIMGPSQEATPAGIHLRRVQTAGEMLEAVKQTLPQHIAICTAAVADWRPKNTIAGKLKKTEGPPGLLLEKNPDILQWICKEAAQKPDLVIGFAAEAENISEYAKAKHRSKGCDWLLANDISEGKVFGKNKTELLGFGIESQPVTWSGSKDEVAQILVQHIIDYFSSNPLSAVS